MEKHFFWNLRLYKQLRRVPKETLLTQPMKFTEETYMLIEDNNAFWDVLMTQIDRIDLLEIKLQELKEQLKHLRH